MALLGTRYTMEQPFYVGHLARHGIGCVIPDDAGRAEVHRVIFDELCKGDFNVGSRERLRRIIERQIDRGAEGVVLGCTELSLTLSRRDVGLPLFDTTALHALAAVDFALGTHRATAAVAPANLIRLARVGLRCFNWATTTLEEPMKNVLRLCSALLAALAVSRPRRRQQMRGRGHRQEAVGRSQNQFREEVRVGRALPPPATPRPRRRSSPDAAKTSFTKKCVEDSVAKNAGAACEAQAAEKKLAGAAKTSFTKKCIAERRRLATRLRCRKAGSRLADLGRLGQSGGEQRP